MLLKAPGTMNSLADTVQMFGPGKESYAVIHEYQQTTCIVVARILEWAETIPTKWKYEMYQCTNHPFDRNRYIKEAWVYNKSDD